MKELNELKQLLNLLRIQWTPELKMTWNTPLLNRAKQVQFLTLLNYKLKFKLHHIDKRYLLSDCFHIGKTIQLRHPLRHPCPMASHKMYCIRKSWLSWYFNWKIGLWNIVIKLIYSKWWAIFVIYTWHSDITIIWSMCYQNFPMPSRRQKHIPPDQLNGLNLSSMCSLLPSNIHIHCTILTSFTIIQRILQKARTYISFGNT